MTFFGIQGLLIPLRDIFALINPKNVEKQIFIVENIQFEEENKGLLSLSYAVSYQSSTNCTNKENITVGELQYFYKWNEMLRALATPISSRPPSATSQISTNTNFLPITNTITNNEDSIPDNSSNYEGDKEDNDDEEDDDEDDKNNNGDESEGTEEEIVNIINNNNNKRAAEQNYESNKKPRTKGGTKKKINKQKNKKTKKQKTKK